MSDPTLRWRGGVAATIVLAVVGFATSNGPILLAAVVLLAYVAYGSLATAELPDGADGEPDRRADAGAARPTGGRYADRDERLRPDALGRPASSTASPGTWP